MTRQPGNQTGAGLNRHGTSPAAAKSFRERMGALRNLGPFVAMVWRTSPALTATSLILRLVRALLPVLTLYVGKLIIDEVVMLAQMSGRPQSFAGWIESGLLSRIGLLIAAEFALATLSDILGRVV